MQILWKLLSALVLTAVPLSAQTLEPKVSSDCGTTLCKASVWQTG